MSRANPMLDLPTFGVLRELPEHTRRDLALVLTDLARDADGRAKTSWERHKGPMAAYWRAVSTYARHTARALVAVETGTRCRVAGGDPMDRRPPGPAPEQGVPGMTTKARTRCWACAWMDRPGAEQRGACMEREPLYEGPMRCTRPRGHADDHVACGSAHHRILSWGQAA